MKEFVWINRIFFSKFGFRASRRKKTRQRLTFRYSQENNLFCVFMIQLELTQFKIVYLWNKIYYFLKVILIFRSKTVKKTLFSGETKTTTEFILFLWNRNFMLLSDEYFDIHVWLSDRNCGLIILFVSSYNTLRWCKCTVC